MIRQAGKPDLNVTIGEDFLEIHDDEDGKHGERKFDPLVSQSVIESDYSSDYDNEDDCSE